MIKYERFNACPDFFTVSAKFVEAGTASLECYLANNSTYDGVARTRTKGSSPLWGIFRTHAYINYFNCLGHRTHLPIFCSYFWCVDADISCYVLKYTDK